MAHKLSKYEEARSLYESGYSIQDVANHYGITRQAMWDILKRRGTVFRNNKRYGKSNHFWRGSSDDDNAQNIVEKAILRGDIVPPDKCSQCGARYKFKDGRRAIQAHHPDYNKPLEVVWLCQRCHHEWHKKNKAIPRMER